MHTSRCLSQNHSFQEKPSMLKDSQKNVPLLHITAYAQKKTKAALKLIPQHVLRKN